MSGELQLEHLRVRVPLRFHRKRPGVGRVLPRLGGRYPVSHRLKESLPSLIASLAASVSMSSANRHYLEVTLRVWIETYRGDWQCGIDKSIPLEIMACIHLVILR